MRKLLISLASGSVLGIALCTANLVAPAEASSLYKARSLVGTSSSPNVRSKAGIELGETYDSRQKNMQDIAEHIVYYTQLRVESHRLDEANQQARERIDTMLRGGSKIAFSMILSDTPMDWGKTPNDHGFVHSYRVTEGVGADSYLDLMRKVYGSYESEIRAPIDTDRLNQSIWYPRAAIKGEMDSNGIIKYSYITQLDQVKYLEDQQKKNADELRLKSMQLNTQSIVEKREAEEAESQRNKKQEETAKKAADEAKRIADAAEEALRKQKAASSIAKNLENQYLICNSDGDSDACKKAKAATAESIEAAESVSNTALCSMDSLSARGPRRDAFRSAAARRPLEVPVRFNGGFMKAQSFAVQARQPFPKIPNRIEDFGPLLPTCTPCPVCSASAHSDLMKQRSWKIDRELSSRQLN